MNGQRCASAGEGRRRRYRGVCQEPCPHGRGRRQGARGLYEAARGRPGRRPACPTRWPTWSRRSARSANYWLSDPSRAVELQSQLGRAYLDLWGAAAKRLSGEEAGPGRHARSEGQALRRSGMVVEPVLRLRQAGLSAHHPLGRPSGRGRQGPRSAHPPEGRVLRPADRQRAVAVELRADQSGTVARDARLQRREPRARHAHAGRGHRGRRRRSENPPVRCGQIRGRPQSRGHARQGDLPKRTDAAHPVRADDAERC